MKLLYLSRARIPSRKAHVTQILNMYDSFMDKNVDVELIHPLRFHSYNPAQSLKEFYGLHHEISRTTLPCIDLPLLRSLTNQTNNKFRLWFWTYATSYAVVVLLYLIYKSAVEKLPLVIYSRDRLTTFALLLLKPLFSLKIFYEIHDLPASFQGGITKKIWANLDGLITITRHQKSNLENLGFPENKISNEPDGVNLKHFRNLPSKKKLREELNLPNNSFLVGYVGHLYTWKGPDVLLELANELPQYHFVTVGGLPELVKKLREDISRNRLKNLTVIEHQPHRKIPKYLTSFDVLLLPSKAEKNQSITTSPLKLFEYMAAGKPIVASRLPSIEEILEHKKNCLLAAPEDSKEFKDAIELLNNDRDLSKKISKQAKQDVKQYSWGARAKRIKHFIKEKLN